MSKSVRIGQLVVGVLAVAAVVAGEALGWGLTPSTVSLLAGLAWLVKSPMDALKSDDG